MIWVTNTCCHHDWRCVTVTDSAIQGLNLMPSVGAASGGHGLVVLSAWVWGVSHQSRGSRSFPSLCTRRTSLAKVCLRLESVSYNSLQAKKMGAALIYLLNLKPARLETQNTQILHTPPGSSFPFFWGGGWRHAFLHWAQTLGAICQSGHFFVIHVQLFPSKHLTP